ncbi:MAG: TIGR03088 family PEP-CTERM/XrtA system glycosyltransferase [Gammaproteobacteria bacterium]
MMNHAPAAQSSTPLIAHVVYRFDMGGLENGLVNLINRLPERQFRHAIVSLTDYSDFRDRLTHDIPIFALNKRPGNDFALYWRLWKTFHQLKPDVVHTRNLNALEAQVPAFLAGVRGRIHGEHGWDVHDQDGRSRKYRWWRRVFRPFVQRYVALSRHIEGYLENEVRVPTDRIVRICNGVDTETFGPPAGGREPLPEVGGAGDVDLVIGTVGRLEAVKDQITLARAFVRLVADQPELMNRCRLVMIGEGSLRPEIERVLSDAGLAGSVWLPGARDDVARLLRGFDVFVLPSKAEGISNTILEAMASGLPVVATDVGGNRELVADGTTGFLVPRDDPEAMAGALLNYVRNPELAKSHGRSARRRIEAEFSIDGMVRRYGDLYSEVLATKCGVLAPAGPSGD